MTVTNSKAVAVISYSAGLIKWTKEELRTIDKKTWKTVTIDKALHPKADAYPKTVEEE